MTDLFENTGDHTETNTDVKIEDLVGEGKKFKSVEDLVRGKLEADRFIEKLKSETEGLRTELNTRIGLEEFLDKLNSNTNSNNQPSGDNQDRASGDNASAGLTPEKIAELVEQKLTEKQKAQQAAENLRVVKQKLAEALGPNYANKLNETSESLGLSRDYLNNLAATAPQAFFKLVGVDAPRQTEDVFTPPSSGFRTTSEPRNVERTQSYYNDLKRKDPKTYWSSQVQVQMHKDATRLGEKFFT